MCITVDHQINTNWWIHLFISLPCQCFTTGAIKARYVFAKVHVKIPFLLMRMGFSIIISVVLNHMLTRGVGYGLGRLSCVHIRVGTSLVVSHELGSFMFSLIHIYHHI